MTCSDRSNRSYSAKAGDVLTISNMPRAMAASFIRDSAPVGFPLRCQCSEVDLRVIVSVQHLSLLEPKINPVQNSDRKENRTCHKEAPQSLSEARKNMRKPGGYAAHSDDPSHLALLFSLILMGQLLVCNLPAGFLRARTTNSCNHATPAL